MRILFASYAERTQALPMAPLAWAARCAGHDVLMATQPSLVDTLADTGMTVVPVGRDLPLYRLWDYADDSGQGDGLVDLVDEAVPLPWESALDGYRDLVQWWFRTANEPMLGDLVSLCRDWRPDLVVWETVTFAGALAARACGVRHLRFVWSYDVLAQMRHRVLAARPAGTTTDPLKEWLSGCAERIGTDWSETLTTGDSTIVVLPESLRRLDPVDIDYRPVRFLPYAGKTVVPSWVRDLAEPRQKPRVCVSLGTSALERFGRLVVPAGELILGIARTGAEVLVTLDDHTQAGLSEAPANVRFVGHQSLEELVRCSDVLVSHAGPGTIATAIAAGVPQLVVAEEFDAPVLARLLATTGAAINLPLDQANADRVQAGVTELLEVSSFRGAARSLQEEALSMPTPRDFIKSLEDEFMTRNNA